MTVVIHVEDEGDGLIRQNFTISYSEILRRSITIASTFRNHRRADVESPNHVFTSWIIEIACEPRNREPGSSRAESVRKQKIPANRFCRRALSTVLKPLAKVPHHCGNSFMNRGCSYWRSAPKISADETYQSLQAAQLWTFQFCSKYEEEDDSYPGPVKIHTL